MTHIYGDRVMAQTNTIGTGDLELLSPLTGYVDFSTVLSDGDTATALISNDDNSATAWEVTAITFNTGTPNTITRGVLQASSTGSRVDFGSGVKQIYLVPTADFFNRVEDIAASLPTTITDDRLLMTEGGTYVLKTSAEIGGAQPGDISFFAGSTPPAGKLKINGAALSRTVYADLFAAIGTTYGAGDGVNTFNLPDARGEFFRVWDDGRGVDTGRVFGSAQSDDLKSHAHTTGFINGFFNATSATSTTGYGTTGGVTGAAGGSETRPRNIAFLACIKY